MNSVARNKKEWMKEQLDTMDTNEHAQIFSIVQKYTSDQFTKTQTGVLVSTDHLSDACLEEIEKYIHFCKDQRKRMEDDIQRRKTYERMIQ